MCQQVPWNNNKNNADLTTTTTRAEAEKTTRAEAGFPVN